MLHESSEFLDVADDNGDTALILAARYGHTEVVRVLISAGANDTRAAPRGAEARGAEAGAGRLSGGGLYFGICHTH